MSDNEQQPKPGSWVRILEGEHRGRKARVHDVQPDAIIVEVVTLASLVAVRSLAMQQVTLMLSDIRPSTPGPSPRLYPPSFIARRQRKP